MCLCGLPRRMAKLHGRSKTKMGIEELSYVLITPYTILKSRTGGVMARLLSRTDLDLVGAQMLAPTMEFSERYAEAIEKTVNERGEPKAAKLFKDYVLTNFSPINGINKRILMLLFKGENACGKLFSIVGHIDPKKKSYESITGETVRDTYSDLVLDDNGEVRYFEPAVLAPPDRKYALEKLKMLAEFAGSQSNLIENVKYADSGKIERTLAIIKPDNWRFPSSKPGNIIDMFSKTGLRIIGCKIYQMSVSDALKFYSSVKDVLREKLSPYIGEKAGEILEAELSVKFNDEQKSRLTEAVGIAYADEQFSQIVEFMSGMRPENCPCDQLEKPGLVKCMVLVYEGKNAVHRIRDVLGPTDPTKAPGGTIRRDFGQDVMMNTAHASDSVESAKREMEIVKIHENTLSSVIKEYLAEAK